MCIRDRYNFSAGGSVKLAKESSYGIVHLGENLTAGNYVVKLVDITVPSSGLVYGAAAIEIYDANGQKVKEDRVASGSTFSWTAPDGTKIKVKVYKATPGYTLAAKWAEMAIYSEEIELKDDDVLDDDNKNWKAKVLWKNRDYDSSSPSPAVDTLWALEIHNTDDPDVPTIKMDKGATYNIPKETAVLQLQYDGLTLTDADYDSLTFNLIKDTIPTKDSSCTSGTDRDAGPQLLQVTSSVSNAFTIGGQTVSTFWVELQNATGGVSSIAGTVFANTGSCYARLSTTLLNASNGVTVNYNPGDGDEPIIFDAGRSDPANPWFFNIGIREDPGNNPAGKTPSASAYDYWNITVLGNSSATATYTFGTAAGLKRINYTQVAYGVGGGGNVAEVDEGRISERGSIFWSLGTSSLVFKMAKKVGEAQYYLKSVGTTPNAPVEVTLAEGEEATLSGGVKIKVASITQDVGACSAAPGSSGCTVDMSGVSAVLNTGGSEVEASVPYHLATDTTPLVVLDKYASTTGTVISVGGPDVNTVTADILAGSGTTIDAATGPTVKVVGDNKIVVAGGSAAQTVEAGNQFIAGLQ